MSTSNTVLAESSCPDELNHDHYHHDVSLLMGNRWGEVFHLGGLAGIPFTGKTGWGAFSHHVPDDGSILVIFAPHVGLTEDGTVGKVHRPGQDHATSACGAAVGAYNAIRADDTSAGVPDPSSNDYQQQYIMHALADKVKEIDENFSDKNERQEQLARAVYEIAHGFLNDIVDFKWMSPKSKLVVLGGLMINIDGDQPDAFEPIMF